MRIPISIPLAAVCAVFLAAGGCSKSESPTTIDKPAPQESTVQKAVNTVTTQTEAVKQVAQDAVTNAQTQATAAADKVTGVIEQAKKLVGENKLSEAMTLLNGLSGQQLTSDQQSVVQSLKEQIQKALGAAKASLTNAAGGLLGK